jgi:glycosyltransferase involved in cell wall biosynthesis
MEMTRVLLIHSGFIPHYRIPIYNSLSEYLGPFGFALTVVSDRIQSDNVQPVNFDYVEMPLSAKRIGHLIRDRRIDVIILFVDMRHKYLFPTYLIAKGLLGKKMIYWGQGLNLANPQSIKNVAYKVEHALCDAIILYAEHLKKYVHTRFHSKTFAANNTLSIGYEALPAERRALVLAEYGIHTTKNIICVGRLQKRKRLNQLVAAHQQMNRSDVGLIFVGPDSENVLHGVSGETIYKLGPIYGDAKFDLISACDVYCLPGAVGLSIVDAFHCGLPFVTEEGDESAEIMYLKDGVNGFVVPRGNVAELARKLLLLLDDHELHRRFSDAARQEIKQNGSIEKLCAGFKNALFHAIGQKEACRSNFQPSSSRLV